MRTVLALLPLLVLAACESGGDDTTDSDADSEVVGDPTLAIVAPAEDAEITGDSVDVRIEVSNVTLVPRGMGTGTGTEGFVILTLDDASAGEIDALTTTISVFPGDHVLKAELVDPDGTPFEPAITDEVSFSSIGL